MAKIILTFRLFPDVDGLPQLSEIGVTPERGRVLSYDELQRARKAVIKGSEDKGIKDAFLVHHIEVR